MADAIMPLSMGGNVMNDTIAKLIIDNIDYTYCINNTSNNITLPSNKTAQFWILQGIIAIGSREYGGSGVTSIIAIIPQITESFTLDNYESQSCKLSTTSSQITINSYVPYFSSIITAVVNI